jgi:16S rRNA processing protein RimM
MDTNHVKIGTVVSKHGYKGSIKVSLLLSNIKAFQDIDFIFLDIDRCLIPFKVDKINSSSDNSIILKLQELNSDEDASEVILKNVYLDKKNSKFIDEESFFYNELLNFVVFKDSKKIGKIVNINDKLPQPVFEILINDKKFMVPIHDDFIQKIDKEKKSIHIVIPDGLLEIT